MRRLRIRFSVTTLLFTVAMIAANCAVFRWLDQPVAYGFGPRDHFQHVVLALLPLGNVPIFGTMWEAAEVDFGSTLFRRVQDVMLHGGFTTWDLG